LSFEIPEWWLEPKSEATGCGPVDSGSITRQPPKFFRLKNSFKLASELFNHKPDLNSFTFLMIQKKHLKSPEIGGIIGI